MNTTETTPITLINSVSFGSYTEGRSLITVPLGNDKTANFHIHEEHTNIRIIGFGGTELRKFRIPTVMTPSVLIFALRNPDSFVEACQAFLTQVS